MRSWRRYEVALSVALVGVLLACATAARADGGTGSISGHVTTTAVAACVLVLGPDGQAVATAPTDGTGSYSVDGIPAGRWIVQFVPDDGCLGDDTSDAFQYYAGAATPATATPVTVTAGETTAGINATLATGALVKGTVTSQAGDPLPGVCVVLEDTAGRPVKRQPTDTDGNYVIDQLPASHFILQFVDDGCVGRAPRYAPAFFGGAATPDAATVLDLHAGQLAGGLDAVLDPLPSGGGPGSGSGPGSGGATAGGASGKPAAPSTAGHKSAPRTVLSLLRASGGRWTVDSHRRLHLRVRCAQHGPACRVTVTVSRVRRRGAHLVAGRRAGSRSVTVRAGRTANVVVALHGVHSGGLWVSARSRDRRLVFQTVLSIRWPSRRGHRARQR